MTWFDLRLAARGLARRPGWSALVLATLGLGVGVNTAVFALVQALLLRPLPFPEPERLVRVQAVVAGGQPGKLSAHEWEELQRDEATFEGVAAYYPSQYNLADGGPPESVAAAMTTGNLFDVLGVRLAHGASWPLAAYRQRHTAVVLGHALWSQRFGSDARLVGRTLPMDAAPYQVVGVAPPGFDFPHGTQVFRAAQLLSAQNSESRSLFVLARLSRGVSQAQAQARLDALALRLAGERPATNAGVMLRLSPLRDLFVGDVRPHLLATSALAAVVLLLAGVNLLHLVLLRASGRRHELALRAALGASRARLAALPLAECLLLGVAGGALALGLAHASGHALRLFLPQSLPWWLAVRVDAPVAAFALAVALGGLLLIGVTPALLASNQRTGALGDGGRAASGGPGQRRTRARLVAFEAAFAVLLLASAGLLLRSLERLLSVDPGFRTARLVTLRADPPWTRYDNVGQTGPFYRRALEELRALPGVEAVAANQSLPLFGNDNYGRPRLLIEGQDEAQLANSPFVNLQIVSPNYLETLGVPLVAGRTFDARDRPDAPAVALVSRALARRAFGRASPLGRRVRLPELLRTTGEREQGWFEIVGVTGDVLADGLSAAPSLDLYLSNQQQFAGDTYFVLRAAGDAGALMRAAAMAVQRVDPEQSVFGWQAYPARLERMHWQRVAAARLAAVFALLALALAAVGTYGVLAQSVSQRRRELGVRQALGASASAVAGLVVREGLGPAALGTAVGLGTALALASAARSLLHEVAPWDVPALLAAALALLLVSLAAGALPAWRAARVDPAAALRQE